MSLWQDVQYGTKLFRKRPGFTLMVILTLGLGIGANTAIFSVVNGVLLRPLPYAQAEQLLLVQETRSDGSPHSVSYPTFADWRAQQSVFASIAAYHDNALTLAGKDAPAHLQAVVVSAELFSLLGAQPLLGRNFTREEDEPGHRVVMLGHALWQTRFGGDPKIIGRQLVLSGKSFTVVGVQRPEFNFPVQPHPVEMWVTTAIDAEKVDDDEPLTAQRGFGAWTVLARLKPNITMQEAQAEMETIESHLAAQYPDDIKGSGLRLISLHEEVVGKTRRALLVLFGAVACVLLIACSNLANLLLARGVTRHKEVLIRAALGASRFRLVQQILTETLLLSLAGGLLGVLLALWGVDLLKALSPENLPRVNEINVDARVLSFTLLTTLLTGFALGLAPALRAAKIELTEALKESGRGGSESWGRNRLRSLLITAEVAIALVLLIGAGLLINSFLRLQRVNPGFNADKVLTFNVDLPDTKYARPEQSIAFHQQLLARLEQLPGVRAASMVFPLPLGGGNAGVRFEVEGQPTPKEKRPNAGLRTAGTNYFATMGIAVLAGREFTTRDEMKAPPVVIINETFARLFFPNVNPIGKHIAPGATLGTGPAPMREIIGVVADVKHSSLSADAVPELYLPYAQLPFGSMSVVVRTATNPRSLVNAVRNELAALDPEVPLDEVETMDEYLAATVAQPKFSTQLLTIFAAVALVLTAIGLYGVISYSVSARTHEMGIRMALGAQAPDVLALVIKQGMLLVLLGLLIGLSVAFALTRLLTSLLYNVSATDPLTFVGVGLLLAVVALVACWLPARRATKVDPMIALRCE